MIRRLRHHIGVKLFALLMFMIVVAVVPLSYVVFSIVTAFSNFTAEVNRDEIENQASSFRSTIAREQAHAYDAFFSKVEVASSLMAAQAREVYDNLSYYGGFTDKVSEQAWQEGQEFITPGHDDVLFSFAGRENMPEQQIRERQALMRLDPVIRGVHQEIPENLGIHLVTVTGIYRLLRHIPEGGERSTLPDRRKEYEKRLAEFLKFFADNPAAVTAGTTWTHVYRDAVDGSLLITALSPVLDSSGELHGAIGVDIPLEKIFAELFGLDQVRREGATDEALFAFLLDAEGRLIAFPDEHRGLFGITAGTQGLGRGSTALNLYLSDSTAGPLSSLVPRLLGTAADVVNVPLDEKQYMLYMHPLHLLNWHLVLVTRHAGENSAVIRTEQALSGTTRLLVRKFAANGLIIAIVLLVVVGLAVSYFVAPLKKLSEAALRVGRGDLKTRCYLHREDELGILAESFNDMVRQLEAAEKIQQDQAKQLELTVQERTRDLRNKNFVLRDVIGELNAESERRKQAVEELRKSKLMLQDSLAEKEVLLREIYHRTKNNMLVIISMLQLQAMDIDDARVKTLFRETENRIRAMSLVHKKLYQSQNLAAIDLGEYLEGMVTALVRNMVLGDHITVEMRCEPLSVSIDSIVPLGLAINEIVTNSLQHAFGDGRQGLLYIRLRQEANGQMEVVVGDDGAGLPADMDLQNPRSFGMQITANLIRRQLHGTLDIARDNGTEYTIRFAEPVRPERL